MRSRLLRARRRRFGTTTTAAAAAVAVLLMLASGLEAAAGAGSSSVVNKVIFSPDLDPYAVKDSFMMLSEAEQLEYWADDRGLTFYDREDAVEWFDYTVHVEVKLVGFDGDSFMGVDLDEDDFRPFFEALDTEIMAHVLGTEDFSEEALPISSYVEYSVTNAPGSLIWDINAELEALFDTDPRATSVPYRTVDKHIEADYEDHGLTYTIYVINSGRFGEAVYSYDLGDGGCGSMMFASETARYAWIDLSAGPLTYGPETAGEGIVTWFSIPRVDMYKFEPELAADLANFVWKTTHHLIAPPVSRQPLNDPRQLGLHFVIISDAGRERVDNPFDVESITKELGKLALPGQILTFPTTRVALSECSGCFSAYMHALKSHTSTVLERSLETRVHQYLDAEELHAQLRRLVPAFADPREEDEEIIPVFVFDLDSPTVLLLDRFHQAVAFEDMVVAVQSQGGKAYVDFECGGKSATIDAKDARRAVLGAVLDAVWAVTPTHRTFGPVHGEIRNNYLWSVGSPFGPLSNSLTLTFAVRDAAWRNAIFASLNATLADMQGLFTHYTRFDREVAEVLIPSEALLFVQRWNVFEYKLGKVNTNLGLQRYDHAIYYLRSLRHDVEALHGLLHDAGRGLHSHVECSSEDSGSATPLVLLSLSVAGVVYALYALGPKRLVEGITRGRFL